MVRPTDWHVLDLDGDPAPGDPVEIQALAGRYLSLGLDVDDAGRRVRALAGNDVVASWVGQSGDAYRDEVGSFGVDLGKMSRSYGMAGRALSVYARELEGAQLQADRALATGREVRAQQDTAEAQVASAQAAVTRTAPAAGPGAGLVVASAFPLPAAEQVAAAARNGQAAQTALRAAQAGSSAAQDELDAARRLAVAARGLRENAEDAAVRQLSAASHAGIRNKSFWKRLEDGAGRVWHATVEVAKVAVVVLGVVLLFVSGPVLVGLLVAASLVLLVQTLHDYRQGHASRFAVALAVVSVLPGGRVAEDAETGVRLTMAGERLAAGASRVRRAVGDRAAIRDVITEPRETAVGVEDRELCADPVDVASGDVVMSQTDVELPGLLPVVIERTHVSSYRVGGVFGRSWASTLDQRLEVEASAVWFAAADGMLLLFPAPPASGAAVLPVEGPRWWLARTRTGYTLTMPGPGRTLEFADADADAHDAERATRPDDVPGLAGATGGVRTLVVSGGFVQATIPPRTVPLTAVVDRDGHRIDITRDAAGAPTALRHSGGYQLALQTVDGRLTAIRLTEPDTEPVTLVSYRYDEDGQLSGVVNSAGLAVRFLYDPAGRLVRWVDRNQVSYAYAYDVAGRCVAGIGTDGVLNATFAYDRQRRATTMTDSLGHATTFQFNAAGQKIAVTDPLGRTTRYEWDRYDRLLARTDPLGRTTRSSYDQDGNRLSLRRPDGSMTHATYNRLGLPVRVTDPDGAVWRQAYDERGNLTALTDPSGATTRYTYGPHGHLTTVTDALGEVTHVATNLVGLPVAATDPTGATTRYTYDPCGRLTAITDPLGGHRRLGWTVEGHLAWRTEPDGATTRYRYDPEGNLVEEIDPVGHITRTEYGPFDLPTARIHADGARDVFTYDTELRLVAVTNPAGQVWRYTHDAAGALTAESDFDGRTLTYTSDAAGRLLTRTNGAGQVTRYAYDLLGNITEQNVGGVAHRFTYDPAGRLLEAVNPAAEVTLRRDQLGRVVAETCNGRTVTSTYDAVGQRVRRRTPAGVDSRWEYDPAGAPRAVRVGGRLVTFGYDAGGRETERRFGDAVALTQEWGGDNRLQTDTLTRPRPGPDRPALGSTPTGGARGPRGRSVRRRSYDYRADGSLAGITDRPDSGETRARRFDLDARGRVTAVGDDSPVQDDIAGAERYTYDTGGKVTASTWRTAGGPLEPGPADPRGSRAYEGTLLRRAGRVRFEYDGQGRVARRHDDQPDGSTRTWRYHWDADDRLTDVHTPDGQHWRYLYDPLGRRISKQRLDPGGPVSEHVTFVWDGAAVAEQTHIADTGGTDHPAGERTTTWEYEPGTFTPLCQIDGDRWRDASRAEVDERFHAIIADLIGTPTELVDLDGQITWRGDTTLWGSPVSPPPDSKVTCPLRFPGQYHDPETGLHYNYHRYYDPTTGLYYTPDPLGLGGGPDPHSYVTNPLEWLDPLGLIGYKKGKTPDPEPEPKKKRGGSDPVKKGERGVAKSEEAARGRGTNVTGREVTIRSGGRRGRLDLVGRDKDGNPALIEAKNGPRARVNPNQKKLFESLEKNGGIPAGKNAKEAGLEPGVAIPPTRVHIDHWEDE